jgi:putative transposase
MAIQVVCGVNQEGRREVLEIEPMLEESCETYSALLEKLKDRGLGTPSLVISDAHKGLVR